MKIAVWLEENTVRLASANIESARLDCLLLLELVLQKDRPWVLANQNDHQLESDQISLLEKHIERRGQNEPIAYITGKVEFYGLELAINENVLVPRPETEELVTMAARLAKPEAKIIDIGTGSGAIGIALKSIRPDLEITLSDISPESLELAQKNISKYSLHDIKLIQSNLMNDISGQFDLILANLPYLEKSVDTSPTISWEPDLALFSPEGGLQHYKKLISRIQEGQFFTESGYLILEAKPSQHKQLISFAENHGLTAQPDFNKPYMLVFSV